MPTWRQFWFQDRNSPIIEEFIIFHDFVLIIMLFVCMAVFLMFSTVLSEKIIDLTILEGETVEYVWTVVPTILLAYMAVPSIIILYTFDEFAVYSVTMKATGHQWYWQYESVTKKERKVLVPVEFNSYIIPTDRLPKNGFRLLDTDRPLVIPARIRTQLLVTSADVLHSWAVPAMGIKADAVPGRLNNLTLTPYVCGVFFGQCSEICGVNHRFIPIVLEVVKRKDFLQWVSSV